MSPIITSLLDNDLYKFSMMWAVLRKFPDLKVKYSFIDRNNIVYPKEFDSLVKMEINKLQFLSLTSLEEQFLQTIRYFPQSYIDFLKGYRFDPNEVQVSIDEENHLHIEIKGYWYRTILWEVPILAIVSELYYQETKQTPTIYFEKDLEKLKLMESHNAFFADFGTRRRYSYVNQYRIVDLFCKYRNNHCFVGTSNVHLAQRCGTKAIGTMAHEWIMAHGAMFGYRMANKLALENWADVYGGDLGIALADTYTTDSFLESFDMKLSKLFDGVRQDSGDPYEFVNKVIAHYKKLGIDPMSKTIVFSDGLDIDKATAIKEYCVAQIKSSFGIGTHLTNDVGVKPLNIVIKLSGVEVNNRWINVVKLSDDKGKYTGDKKEIELCKNVLNIK
jgi:nicotinate phosphoribosyltransferase